MLKDAHLMLMA